MPVVEINDLARLGQINDVAPYMLPPEAWTLVENMRYLKSGPTVLDGWSPTFGTVTGAPPVVSPPPIPPYFAMPYKTATKIWWLYTGLVRAYVWDGTTHTEITRVSGVYASVNTEDWNGFVFGGVPIFNNGIDAPQAWIGTPATTLKLVDLPNWPAGQKAKILRNFGSYLIAFNVSDGPLVYPHLVHWSNPAAPGFVPTSWDYANPAVESGRKDLPDVNAGIILEAMQLGSIMFIYKERSIWKMQYIGGQFIYQFDTFLADVGIIAARCVCMDITGTRHVVATQDDIIIHNGNSTESVLTDRQRQSLFGSMNREAASTCFMFLNKVKDEIWFCYPEAGEVQPSRALIWNAKGGKGAISFASGITFRNAMLGDMEGVQSEAWDVGTDTWNENTGPWSEVFKQKIVLCAPDVTKDLSYSVFKFYLLDSGTTRDGLDFAPKLVREDLGVVGQKRDGGWINDFKQMKMVDSVWPKMQGAGAIRIRVGFREFVDGPLTWQDYTTFDPNDNLWVNTIVNEDLPGCGKAVSIEFSAETAAPWRLDGYAMNVEVIGVY